MVLRTIKYINKMAKIKENPHFEDEINCKCEGCNEPILENESHCENRHSTCL